MRIRRPADAEPLKEAVVEASTVVSKRLDVLDRRLSDLEQVVSEVRKALEIPSNPAQSDQGASGADVTDGKSTREARAERAAKLKERTSAALDDGQKQRPTQEHRRRAESANRRPEEAVGAKRAQKAASLPPRPSTPTEPAGRSVIPPRSDTSDAEAVEAFEDAVFRQQQVGADHYDNEYFASDWREGDNRYDVETRRRIEDRNPHLIKDVFVPERVLDVGCGPGFLMLFLHELGVEVQGIDFSESSRQLAPTEVRDRITIGSVAEPQVPPASYDLVICREVAEHLTVLQVRKTVHELCRASSRFVYLTTRFHPEPGNLLDFTTQFEVDPSHITLLNKEFLRVLFVLEGFGRRPDLEARMDWAGKNRVLVYERRCD